MMTEVNHNKQYQNNEKRILQGYLSELKLRGADSAITLSSIAEASDVPYRTVLGHYINFYELERSNVEDTANILCQLADESRLMGDDSRAFLKKLLLTITRESLRFQIEYTRRSISVWERALLYSKDILTQGWGSYGAETDDIIFHRFCAEFIGTIFLWGKSGFSITELGIHLTTLLYLVEHATKRELLIQGYLG